MTETLPFSTLTSHEYLMHHLQARVGQGGTVTVDGDTITLTCTELEASLLNDILYRGESVKPSNDNMVRTQWK